MQRTSVTAGKEYTNRKQERRGRERHASHKQERNAYNSKQEGQGGKDTLKQENISRSSRKNLLQIKRSHPLGGKENIEGEIEEKF